MPIYEYRCVEHGVFEELRPMRDSRLPADCPECGGSGARILSRPHLQAVPRSEMIARERNERSQHEPRVAKSSCGHDHHQHASPAAPKSTQPQVYKGPRPWVMEHA